MPFLWPNFDHGATFPECGAEVYGVRSESRPIGARFTLTAMDEVERIVGAIQARRRETSPSRALLVAISGIDASGNDLAVWIARRARHRGRRPEESLEEGGHAPLERPHRPRLAVPTGGPCPPQ
jgi:hypothetical protein